MIDTFYRLSYLPLKNALNHRRRISRRIAGRTCRSSRPERLAVILLSYRRPKNIDKILSSLVLCEFIDEIILSNNNPEFPIEKYLHIQDPRLRIINQPERRYPSYRLELSLEAKSEFLLAIDDDVFPEPEQILGLFEILLETPSLPHGVGGQVFSEDLTKAEEIAGRDTPVESLMWLFAYTREHVMKYFEMLNTLRIDNRQLDSSEDVPLSFTGESFALIHDLGPVFRCPTSTKAGVATLQTPGFFQQRTRLVRQMRELRGFDRKWLME